MKKKLLILLTAVLTVGALISFYIYQTNNTPKFYPSDETVSAYLRKYGWETESERITLRDIIIPCKFNEVYSEYNSIQQKQGFDLEDFKGNPAILITCHVTNYAGIENVSAQLIISENRIIGANLICPGENGFIKPLNIH